MNVSIIIPAYNEEKRIKSVIINLENALKRYFKSYEIIVVLDGCTDSTMDVVKSMKSKQLYYISLKKVGKGGAIQKGFSVAKGRVIGFVDADDAFDADTLLRRVKQTLSNGKCDCLVASKWINKSFLEVKEPFLRKFLSRGWNIIIRLLFNLKLYDTQGGAKFLKKEAYDKLKKDFVCKGFEFDVELLWKLKKNGFRVKEVYIPNKYVKASKFKYEHIFSMLVNIVRLRIKEL